MHLLFLKVVAGGECYQVIFQLTNDSTCFSGIIIKKINNMKLENRNQV